MAGTKWYGEYLQGSLGDKEAGALRNLIENYDEVQSLTHIIYDLAKHEIIDLVEEYESYEKKHKSLKGFVSTPRNYTMGKLRPAQTCGVAFLYYAGSALLGDEVGLGKTVQVAGLVNLLRQEKPNLRYCFLTEKASISQIRSKMIKFTGQYVGMLESGTQSIVSKYLNGVEQGNRYSIVGGHSLLESSEFLIYAAKNPFDLIIVDESAILKNTTSDIYKNTEQLFKRHTRKLLLNATPFEQNLLEVYNQLHLVDPELLPSREVFKHRYCKLKRGVFGYDDIAGYKNTEEFKKSIGLRYRAKTRAELGAEYIDNSFEVVLVPLSDVQKQLSKKTTLYQMVFDYPPGVDRNVPFNITTTPKAAALLEIINDIDTSTGKVLVYCRFKDCQLKLQELLELQGYRVAILNGDTKNKARNVILTQFTSGGFDIMLTNIQKGLDLQNCDTCIMYTIDPNPQRMVQVEGRMTREFDVMYKSLYLIVSMGREKKFVEEVLKLRAEASDKLVVTGNSMTLEALKGNAKIRVFGESK